MFKKMRKKQVRLYYNLIYILIIVIITIPVNGGNNISKTIIDNYKNSLNTQINGNISIIWNNGGFANGSAFSSQTGGWFNSQVADDIIFDQPVQITGVHWWGCVVGDIYPNPSPFNVIFYADDGSGTMPTGAGMDDPSSTALAINFLPSVIGIPFSPYDTWLEYNATLQEPFPAIGNTKYWIVIQEINETSQWFWWTNGNNPDYLHDAVQGFPELGVPYWTNLESSDMAFYLTGHLNIPPSSPLIHGPTDGVVNIGYDFWTDPITDPSGDSLCIRWDWDDGNITDWLGPYSSGSMASASHSWTQGGIYEVRAQLNGIGGESNWSEPHTITIVQNQTPSTPLITGPSQGKPRISYNYEIESIDPENENISYYIDWGDGTNTGWIGPHPSGQEQTLNHTWNKKGTYTIKAKARDIHDQESNWGILSVTMPYEPPHFRFFEWLFERFPHAFPLLRYLLNF
jgi:hypothetical protein